MLKILMGKSAAGKDTLLNKLVAQGKYKPIISYTTRPMREGETDGVEYHFVTETQFFEKINNTQLLEYRYYDTLVNGISQRWYYGSPLIDIKSDNYIIILDVNGASEYIRLYDKDYIELVYLNVPDDVREERAKKRGSFDKTEWDRRLKDDTEKFSKKNLRALETRYGRKIQTI